MSAEIQMAIYELRQTKEIPEVTSPKKVKSLARRASEVLGYNTLLNIVGSGRLQAALEELEIETLDKLAVYKYQCKFGRPIMTMNASGKPSAVPSSGFLIDADNEGVQKMQDGSFISAGWARGDIWARTGIREYAEAIPEFVLNKAVQIKETLPEANVYVEHLVENPDPFLVVVFEGEEFYVEIWEEPKFEGRITYEESSSRKHEK